MKVFSTKGEVKTAIKSLRRNRARSVLTMLGVIIGVASVITAISIGEGVQHRVSSQTEHLGKNLITIRPTPLSMSSTPSQLGALSSLANLGTIGSLSNSDLGAVLKTSGVADAIPLSLVGGGVVSGETNQSFNTLVIGTNSSFPTMLNQSLAYGGFFNDDQIAVNQVIIGSHIAKKLFTENVPLGQTLSILGHRFIVIGIFSDFQAAPLSVDVDFNDAVFIPYTTAEQITNNDSPIYEILARSQHTTETNAVELRLKSNLLTAHGGQQDFVVLKQGQTLAITNNIINLLTTLIACVAVIALLVGGVGIMNVMLVAVSERMHEIGIRKAIGATNKQILNQFIVEATVLSISGGLIGTVLALLVDVGLRVFTDSLNPAITWPIMAIAFLVAIGEGVVFGSIPALQAARKDPIDALRNE